MYIFIVTYLTILTKYRYRYREILSISYQYRIRIQIEKVISSSVTVARRYGVEKVNRQKTLTETSV